MSGAEHDDSGGPSGSPPFSLGHAGTIRAREALGLWGTIEDIKPLIAEARHPTPAGVRCAVEMIDRLPVNRLGNLLVALEEVDAHVVLRHGPYEVDTADADELCRLNRAGRPLRQQHMAESAAAKKRWGLA